MCSKRTQQTFFARYLIFSFSNPNGGAIYRLRMKAGDQRRQPLLHILCGRPPSLVAVRWLSTGCAHVSWQHWQPLSLCVSECVSVKKSFHSLTIASLSAKSAILPPPAANSQILARCYLLLALIYDHQQIACVVCYTDLFIILDPITTTTTTTTTTPFRPNPTEPLHEHHGKRVCEPLQGPLRQEGDAHSDGRSWRRR